MRLTRALALTATAAGAGASLYIGLVTGALTLDVGVGRRVRALGPIEIEISAARRIVYGVAAAPYAERPTRAMREKVQVLERGDGMVLAAHRTTLGDRLTATTVETVTFDPPAQIRFRLLRGPVPHVTETFSFIETSDTTTTLLYDGELGTDGWALGERWGAVVARSWVSTVRGSMRQIQAESERRSRH